MKQPDVRPYLDNKGRERYRLQLPYFYTYYNNRMGVYCRLIVPAGFEHDGASIPRLLWSLSGLRPDGLLRAAALVHDFLYRYDGHVPLGHQQILVQEGDKKKWVDVEGRWSRQDADILFRKMLKEAGVSTFSRRNAYYAVHWFGRGFFHKDW